MINPVEIHLSDRALSLLQQTCKAQALTPSALIEKLLLDAAAQPPWVTQSQLQELEQRLVKLIEQNLQNTGSPLPAIASPTVAIHQLQIGDLVKIKDADSDFFNQVVVITKVGMARATVQTPRGEVSFLKRDLHYQTQD
ncbi:MAG: hypothetical protein SFT94_05745 [Pseudanabaenaceae cyanobacterium bins.68]|nr:hypothetical protein [Pseudanabaenaceae cyanobacterium bins.68]